MRTGGTFACLQHGRQREHCRFAENTVSDARRTLDRPAKNDKTEAVRTPMRRTQYLNRQKLTGSFCLDDATPTRRMSTVTSRHGKKTRQLCILRHYLKTHNCQTRAQSHTSCPSPVHGAVWVLQVLHMKHSTMKPTIVPNLPWFCDKVLGSRPANPMVWIQGVGNFTETVRI